MRYVFFNIYGESARGIAPTDSYEKALANGKMFELEVYDQVEEKVIWDPQK